MARFALLVDPDELHPELLINLLPVDRLRSFCDTLNLKTPQLWYTVMEFAQACEVSDQDPTEDDASVALAMVGKCREQVADAVYAKHLDTNTVLTAYTKVLVWSDEELDGTTTNDDWN